MQVSICPILLASLLIANSGCTRSSQIPIDKSPARSQVEIDETYLAKRIAKALERLFDRWYMRWAQRGERQVPEIIVLLSSLKNDTNGVFSKVKVEQFLKTGSKRYQLICALNWSEEEIAAKLEDLRMQKWAYQAERDQTLALFVAKGRVSLIKHPFSQLEDYRLQLIWENPETLAEQDEIEEVLALPNT